MQLRWHAFNPCAGVANLAIQNDVKTPLKRPKPLQIGTHLRVLGESFPMNTNMTRFIYIQKYMPSYTLDNSSLNIKRVFITWTDQLDLK